MMMARWRVPVPPVNVYRWWHGYLGHMLEGALAAGVMVAGPSAGGWATGLSALR